MVYFFYLQAPFTHGEDGIQAVPRGKLFGLLDLTNTLAMYYVVLAIFLAGFLLIYRAIHSPFGQVLKAIRENEPRAISLGYDVDRYKLLAFVLSAALAGLAGATKAIVFQLASLTDVHWTMSGEVVLMTLLGGMGTIFGPVVGAFVIIALENYLAALRRVGHRHHRRDLRRLRARVPARHRRRDCGVVGTARQVASLVVLVATMQAAGAAKGAEALSVVGACRGGVPNGAYELHGKDGRMRASRCLRVRPQDRNLHFLDRRWRAQRGDPLRQRCAYRHGGPVVHKCPSRVGAQTRSAIPQQRVARGTALLPSKRRPAHRMPTTSTDGSSARKPGMRAGTCCRGAGASACRPRCGAENRLLAQFDATIGANLPRCE